MLLTTEFTDMIFNCYKSKFDKLDLLFNQETNSKIKSVNIFINLESILNKLHIGDVEDWLSAMKKSEKRKYHYSIIVNIFNLAAHYRRYFTKNKIKSNIVFFMNDYDKYSNFNNKLFIPEYRDKFIYNYTQNIKYTSINYILSVVVKNIRLISDYIENVYYVSTDRLESSIIPELILNKLDGKINLLITSDEYDLQYVNKNFLIIYRYYDKMSIITKKNLFNFLCEKYEIKPKYELPNYILTFALSVTGSKRRSIPKIPGWSWKSIYKAIWKLYQETDISENEIVQLEHLIAAIKKEDKKEIITNNYMCTDIDRQCKMVSDSQLTSVTQQLKDLYEFDVLKDLNERYFTEEPIMIQELNQYK